MHPSFCLWIFTEKDGVRSHDVSDNDFWGVGAEWFSCCLLFLFRCCLIFLMMSMKIIKPLFQKISKTNKFKKSKQNSTAVHLALRAAASLSKGLFLYPISTGPDPVGTGRCPPLTISLDMGGWWPVNSRNDWNGDCQALQGPEAVCVPASPSMCLW